MQADKANEMASADAGAIKGTSIGYAISLIMDYGSGRQMTISGTLPLNATLPEMNAELDKLRLATNRQGSLVVRRDIENSVEMGKKTVAGLKLALATYNSEIEKEITRISESPEAKHSTVKAQVNNMRAQASNHALTKNDEILRAQTDVDKGEAILAKIKQEIGEDK